MRHLILLSILGLLGLTACAEMSRVPESEMQKSPGTLGLRAYLPPAS
jgi:hypothetical protein